MLALSLQLGDIHILEVVHVARQAEELLLSIDPRVLRPHSLDL